MTLAAASGSITVGGLLSVQSIMPIGPGTYRISNLEGLWS